MKTPMQQLQEKITALINDSKGDETRTGDYRIGLHQALSLIDLEAEKEQIWMAFTDGKVSEIVKKKRTPEQYYNLTYKSDE